MILFATVVGWGSSFSFVSTSPLAEGLPLLETPSTSLPMFISSAFGSARCRVGICNTVPFVLLPGLILYVNHLCVSPVCCWHPFFLLSPSDLLELVLNECLHCRLAREAPVSWLFLLLPRIATCHHSWIVPFLLQVLKFLKIRITQYHSSNCDLNLSSLLDIAVMLLADVLEVWCFMSFNASYLSL